MKGSIDSTTDPYIPSRALMRSDMPEGYVPPDELPRPATAAPPPHRPWPHLVMWALRVVAALDGLIALLQLVSAVLLAFGAVTWSPLDWVLGPISANERTFLTRAVLLTALRGLGDALLLTGLAEGIALTLRSREQPSGKRGAQRKGKRATAVPSHAAGGPRQAVAT